MSICKNQIEQSAAADTPAGALIHTTFQVSGGGAASPVAGLDYLADWRGSVCEVHSDAFVGKQRGRVYSQGAFIK